MSDPGTVTTESLIEGFQPVADQHRMRFRLVNARKKTRVLIMVSKIGHCLNDLLFRAKSGQLPIDVPLIVSNHPDYQTLQEISGYYGPDWTSGSGGSGRGHGRIMLLDGGGRWRRVCIRLGTLPLKRESVRFIRSSGIVATREYDVT